MSENDQWGGEERRHCGNHETNTKDISRIKGWLAGITLMFGGVGTVAVFVLGNYMSGIDKRLEKIETTTVKTSEAVSILAVNNAVTRTEVEQLKKDVQRIEQEIDKLHSVQPKR